ncbi:putative gustatory receptor 28b [Copidosoma floridanum]|uniref:putative gustatory receptor 28b n=1 Tax=Copidosoma floridanum TaxID=29053 RepID=UPI0006C95EBC|nr:putative gustatory receptor 28b [Copidosoma floridanum]
MVPSKSANKASRLSFLLLVFKLFGLATFSAKAASTDLRLARSRPGLLYNLVLGLTIGWTNLACLELPAQKQHALTLFSTIDSFEVLFGTTVALLILSFYCLRQRASIRLARKLLGVATASRALGLEREDGPVLSIGFHLLVFAVVLVSGLACFGEHAHLIGSATRNLVVTWLILQYSLVTGFLASTFNSVNHALEELQESRGVLVSPGRLRFLSGLRDLHHLAIEVCRDAVEFYQLTILGCVAYMFVCLVVLLYFFIDPFIEGRIFFSLVEYCHFFMWLVSFAAAFVTLSRRVAQTGNQIDRTGVIVHRLMGSTLNQNILEELKAFSMYLLHARLKFSAWILFALDGSLVQSVSGSITTYLVILVQFELDFSNKRTYSALNETLAGLPTDLQKI